MPVSKEERSRLLAVAKWHRQKSQQAKYAGLSKESDRHWNEYIKLMQRIGEMKEFRVYTTQEMNNEAVS